MKRLIFWEMNEINFDYVNFYISKGKLPNWKKFIEMHGLYTTISEKKYEEIEPWIQWPTVRTGLVFNEHAIFRLGDIASSGVRQHWEILEEKGYSVAAISPINGGNNTTKSPFWMPDPWVDTKVSGKGFIKRFSLAIKQAVNDNSQEKLEARTIISILEAILSKSQLSSWPQYLSGVFGAIKKQHWSKAIILDRLLADVFISLWRDYQPDFSVLFLNSGAHIQHHYMCSSAPYTGKVKNPSWYVDEKRDPLLDLLEMYDAILYDLKKLKNTRLIIATGLQQVPYEAPTFYWRLINHNQFLSKLGIKFNRVQPRMTRDFLLEFNKPEELIYAENVLANVKSVGGKSIFGERDNRGDDLFVTLTYDEDIGDDFSIFLNEKEYKNFKNDVVFVAIKNGHHDTLGYYLDSNRKPKELEKNIPLPHLFGFVLEHFNCNSK